jgi:hypothetical protein
VYVRNVYPFERVGLDSVSVDVAGFATDNRFPNAGGTVSIPHYDDGTIDRWRLEPKLHGLEIDDPPGSDVAPPLWKDLTLALAIAAALWMIAAILFR